MSVLSKSLFVERMLECMADADVSRETLASELRLSKATVGRWLTQGKTHQFPTLEQFVEVCDVLGVSQTYITLGTGPMKDKHGAQYRATYRRYVEDKEFAALVQVLQQAPQEALPPLTAALSHLLHQAPPTTG